MEIPGAVMPWTPGFPEIVEKASSLLSEDEISVERIITELNQRDKYEKLKRL